MPTLVIINFLERLFRESLDCYLIGSRMPPMAAIKEIRCPSCERMRSVLVEVIRKGNYLERHLICRTCKYEWGEAKPVKPPKS